MLAYPSLDEGFGFPLLEAMQAGVPVVATAAGAIPEVAGDAALLVDPHDVDALAAALAGRVADERGPRPLVDHGRVAAGDRSPGRQRPKASPPSTVEPMEAKPR